MSARTEGSAAYAGAMENIADVAALLADRSRVAMLDVLLDGAAHPVGALADAAGIAPSTASEHLARLAAAGLVSGRAEGRRRVYAIADPGVAMTLEALSTLGDTPHANGLRSWNKMQRLRAARTCYDHLAGRLGVFLADAAQQNGALTADYALSETAPRWFERLGLSIDELPRTRRPFLRVCIDWTERREHLAGTLGAAVCASLLSMGWVSRVPGGREVRVTPLGAEALAELGYRDAEQTTIIARAGRGTFPTGEPELRLEVEAHSRTAERLLDQAATELRVVFADGLVEPERGKTRELCERLYPELLAA